ncbi:MAG: methyltransferase domain-containing protein [Alphaproteobacteria bacterium]|nr:methyltransferase domain-containing protein [Alphaproteobacteria bacterium]MDE2011877.1 methyltransferase domain-containing protein [Alphaproteobacteria bacterium]
MGNDVDPLEDAENLIAAGRAGEAAALLGRHIAQGRGGVLTRLTLARALLLAGKTTEALEMSRETAQLYPGVAGAALALGETLLAAGKLPLAIAEFQRALRVDPHLAKAAFLLGCAWLEAGEPDWALREFARIPDYEPANLLVARVAEAESLKAAARSNPRYVRHLFDQFSIDYDERMIGQLSYRAPATLRELAALVLPGRKGLDILDLGCGTGLAGVAFADRAARLDGVDLSPQMIEKARARGVYADLAVADLETFLEEEGCAYDLILAADTLVYLGDLARVFAGAARRLKKDGVFLFTVEKKDGEGFELGPKRRWRHSESYLRETAAAAGLDVTGLIAASPRNEANVPVEGFAVALTALPH